METYSSKTKKKHSAKYSFSTLKGFHYSIMDEWQHLMPLSHMSSFGLY